LGHAGQAQLQALPAPAAAAAAGVTGALVPAAAGSPAAGEGHTTLFNTLFCLENQHMVCICLSCGSPAAGEAPNLAHATTLNMTCCVEARAWCTGV
jgi:hypothetical protein